MLSEKERTALGDFITRTVLEASGQRCTVQRRVPTTGPLGDPTGGNTLQTVYTSLPCLLTLHRRERASAVVAGQETDDTTYRLRAAWDIDLRQGDVVTITGVAYDVKEVYSAHAYRGNITAEVVARRRAS